VENKRVLDVLRLAMVEYSKAFEQAVKSWCNAPQALLFETNYCVIAFMKSKSAAQSVPNELNFRD
jgi:hypothetical protein